MKRIKKSMAFMLTLAMIASMITVYNPSPVYADDISNYTEVWSNVNTTQVTSNPSKATTFIVPNGKVLNLKAITLYHYNSGYGATPGTVTLKMGAKVIGTWNATGRYYNQWWDVFTSKILSAGTYSITCSSNATWSCNSISNYSGFAAVYGTYSDAKKATNKSSKKIYLSKKSAKLKKGQTLKLKLKNAKASQVKWSTSKKKVATVSKKGVVKAKKKGKATITAKYKGKKYKCKIIVKKGGLTRKQAFDKVKKYVKKNGYKETPSIYRVNLGKDSAGFKYSFVYWEEGNLVGCFAESNKTAVLLLISTNKKKTYCEYGKITKGLEADYIYRTKTFDCSSFKRSSTKLTYNHISGTKQDGKTVNNMANAMLQWAFSDFNKHMKKKIGVTMKQLGFNKWNK
jgi:predicted secreted protein